MSDLDKIQGCECVLHVLLLNCRINVKHSINQTKWVLLLFCKIAAQLYFTFLYVLRKVLCIDVIVTVIKLCFIASSHSFIASANAFQLLGNIKLHILRYDTMKISSLREFVENKSDIITMACFRSWHKSTNIYAETYKIAITSDMI